MLNKLRLNHPIVGISIMKKLKRGLLDSKEGSGRITILPTPIKSESDKKSYKAIQLQNQMKVLLVSDGPDLYREEDINISDSDSESSYSSSQSCSSSGEENESELEDNDPAYESCSSLENVKQDKFAACALSVKVGSFCDPKEIPGLAHFLEHMVFMGSEKYPNENQFDKYIAKHGGSTNAVTSNEFTIFYFDCNVKYLFKALNMFSQFFISPLLKKESMVREREAVDSEFDLATTSDSARVDQIISLLANEENPVSKFSWGDSRTLKDGVSEDELYKSLRQFHNKYYSANLMTLAILAKLPLETLENCATECFSQVPNTRVPEPCYHISQPLFDRDNFCKIYYVDSIKDVNKVCLMWQMPPVLQYYKTKPDDVIAWFLAHEGKGSLLSYLKSKLWAINLWGGITNDCTYSNSLFSLFRLEIGLSTEGFTHVYDVITAAFSFIKLVQRSLPNKRAFSEIKMLSDIDFRFQEEQSTTDFVESVVEDMQQYPIQDVLTGPQLFFDYDPDHLVNLLSHIDSDSTNIIIMAKDFKPLDVVLNETETWFKTKFALKNIPVDMRKKWKTIEPYPEFSLPSTNTYISTDFQILKGAEQKYPTRIESNDLMEIWYKLDAVFKLPIASINLHFISAIGSSASCKSLVMLDLFTVVLIYQLTEEVYPAHLAQLHYNVEITSRGGVLIKTKGFNHKLPNLLITILKCIKNFNNEFNEGMFEMLKSELKRDYKNTALKRENLVQELRRYVTEEPFYNSVEKHNCLSSVSSEEFLKYIARYFNGYYVQCLVQGNISKDQAIDVCSKAIKIFAPVPVAKKDLPRIRIHRIPIGQKAVFLKTLNNMDTNSATVNYYQWGPANILQSTKLELLVKLMEESVFNILRTKEQLGYEVYSTFRTSHGIIGFTIIVHSSRSKFDTAFVEQRITLFLQNFAKTLDSMKTDEFLKEREALIKSKSVVYDNLQQEVDYNLHEVITEEYTFDRRFKEIGCLSEKISLENIRNMLGEILKKDSDRNRSLTVQVVGTKGTEASEKASSDASATVGENLKIEFIKGNMKKENYYILDVEKFKQPLYLFAESKVLDVAAEIPPSRSFTKKERKPTLTRLKHAEEKNSKR